MSDQDSLSRETRTFIVLVALLQGLLLWFAKTGQEHQWWPLSELGGRICWYTLVLGVPSAMTLTVIRLGDRRFWQHALLVFGVLALLATWAVWSATGAPGLQSSSVLSPYGFTTTLALFIALPWLQCRLQYGRWGGPYADLFEHAWQNALTLLVTLTFVGTCWGVLKLWAELFALVKIQFFHDLFQESAFIYLASGAMVGLGVLIGRTQQRAIRIARQIVLAIFTGLLPLLAFIVMLFAISLLFTGLESLWKTRAATAILMTLVGANIVFVNAVYQNGEHAPPYPAWLRRFMEIGLLVLPIHAALGLFALQLRVRQYGWTQDRYWALLVCLVLTAYAVGYAYAAMRRNAQWLAPLRRVNIVLSLVVIALVIASNSLLFDPHRLAVSDQVARWKDGRTDGKHLDLEHLRFDSGRRGYVAAQALRDDARIKADAALTGKLAKVLERQQRNDWKSPQDKRSSAVTTIEQIAAIVRPATGSPEPDPALLQTLLEIDASRANCRQPGDDCIAIARDFDGDGSVDWLICDARYSSILCQLWDRARDGRWRQAVHFWLYAKDDGDGVRALRAGEITLVPKRWPALKIGSDTIEPTDN
jgi:hypothetical protein